MTTDASGRIAALHQEVVSMELNEPFAISGGSETRARIVVVTVTLQDGTVGIGEAAPLAAYDGETVEAAQDALLLATDLVGKNVRRFREVADGLRAVAVRSRSARFALETAILDAWCRQQRLSMFEWFGGLGPTVMRTDVTIPIGSVESAARSAQRWSQRGFSVLKTKVGGPQDLERVLAIHEQAPRASLLLDANAGWNQAQALSFLDELRRHGIEPALLEQPLPAGDWNGLRALVDAGARVALDESIATAADVLEAWKKLGSNFVVNVKLMKFGILDALEVVAVTKASGASLMIGGMLESSLAMTTSACFAAGVGGFEFVDLDTHLFLKDPPFRGGLTLEGECLSVAAVDLGHGVSLVRDRRGAPESVPSDA